MRALPRSVVGFALVGIVNTLIDVVLFWVLHAPLGIVAANFVSTSAGMTFSFLVNGRHSFGASQVTLRQALLFLATNAFTMWLLQPLLIHTAYAVWPRERSTGTELSTELSTEPSTEPSSALGLRPVRRRAGLVAAPEAARR